MGKYHVMIVDYAREMFLVTADRRLPIVEFESSYYGDLEELLDQAEALIHGACSLVYLRCEAERVYPELNDSIKASLLIFEVRDCSTPIQIPSFDWVSQRDADVIEVFPRIVEVVQYLQKYKIHGLGINDKRLWPFSRPGWYKHASEWVTTEIQRTTGQSVADIVKVSAHEGGCVLRARTETGETFYMKAAIPNKNWEVFVAAALSEVLGDYFAAPLATNDKLGYLLMKDYGKLLSQDDCSLISNPETYRYIQRDWAEKQRMSIELVDELERRGVPVRGPQWLRNKISEMSSDPEWFAVQARVVRETGREEYEHEEYKRKYMEHVENVLEKVGELQLPLTLVHGDLHYLNVAKDKQGQLTIFDFEDSAIGFGFLDSINFATVCNMDERGNIYNSYESVVPFIKACAPGLDVKRLQEYYPWLEALENLTMACKSYNRWVRSEECGRIFLKDEMALHRAYRTFS